MNATRSDWSDPDVRKAYLDAVSLARAAEYRCEEIAAIFRKRTKMCAIIDPIAHRAGPDGLNFLQHLVSAECALPRHPLIADSLGQWLMRFLHGEPSTVFTICCPDYSWEPNTDGTTSLPFRYTFQDLWDGVGITAYRALRQLPELWRFLQELAAQHGVTPNVQFVVSIADNEVESESLLAQCGIDAAEFLARCQRSLEALTAALHSRDPTMPVVPRLVTQVPVSPWQQLMSRSREIMAEGGYFGRLTLVGDPTWQQAQWDRTVRSRRNIYSRMHPGRDPHDCLREQGADYVLSGLMMAELPNCFYFGVDNHAMELFMQGGTRGYDVRPVAYMIANYT